MCPDVPISHHQAAKEEARRTARKKNGLSGWKHTRETALFVLPNGAWLSISQETNDTSTNSVIGRTQNLKLENGIVTSQSY